LRGREIAIPDRDSRPTKQRFSRKRDATISGANYCRATSRHVNRIKRKIRKIYLREREKETRRIHKTLSKSRSNDHAGVRFNPSVVHVPFSDTPPRPASHIIEWNRDSYMLRLRNANANCISPRRISSDQGTPRRCEKSRNRISRRALGQRYLTLSCNFLSLLYKISLLQFYMHTQFYIIYKTKGYKIVNKIIFSHFCHFLHQRSN